MDGQRKGPSVNSRANTQELREQYSRIEKAKRRTMRRRAIGSETRAWMHELGERICRSGILTDQLAIHEKFAVVFIINQLFHSGNRRAKIVKEYVQRTLILYHLEELEVRIVQDGRYADTYEISFDIWSTHLPQSLVTEGKLERLDRPGVKASHQRLFRNLSGNGQR